MVEIIKLSAEEIMRRVMLDENGNFRPNAQALITNRFLEGSFFATAFALRQKPDLIHKINAGGVCVLPFDDVLEQFSPPALDFYKNANKYNYVGIMFHPESDRKIDVGYSRDEVLLTLTYAENENSTHFFSIIKDSDEIKIPRGIVKKVVGTSDLKKASEQALNNLEGKLKAGQIGPFPLGVHNPTFYFDKEQLEKRGDTLITLPTGNKHLSLYITYNSIPNVLRESYGCNVEIISVFNN